MCNSGRRGRERGGGGGRGGGKGGERERERGGGGQIERESQFRLEMQITSSPTIPVLHEGCLFGSIMQLASKNQDINAMMMHAYSNLLQFRTLDSGCLKNWDAGYYDHHT